MSSALPAPGDLDGRQDAFHNASETHREALGGVGITALVLPNAGRGS
jgi:hypothetical protein